MSTALPAPFPALSDLESDPRLDRNPAIRLFGKRFVADQGQLELLAEFLAVAFCPKRIGGIPVDTPLPEPDLLASWPRDARLQYRPPVRLNLKLFAFLAASPVDSRHLVHRNQYDALVHRMTQRVVGGGGDPAQVVQWLEDALRAFQGAGAGRTWCAQTFMPVSEAFITQETIWNETEARRSGVPDWQEAVSHLHRYFSVSRHRFLARGGELLYLQVCNALATDPSTIAPFAESLEGCITAEEANPRSLHQALQAALAGLKGQGSPALSRLADLIEGLDPETQRAVDRARSNGEGWVGCEWCPRESWPEGYLFAIELSRVLRAVLDPVEQLEMLAVGCALQVLRSLCAQSARYAGLERASAPLGYAWILTPLEGGPRPLRLASQSSLRVVERLIHHALRAEPLAKHASSASKDLYPEADSKYGHKLFRSLGKRLGLIVPRRGPGARFTLTDRLLRYLVLALLRPGERCTYTAFIERLYLHYGIAIEGDRLNQAARWSGWTPNRSIQPGEPSWLHVALRAGGFLTELSDACSVVRNTCTLDDLPTGGLS